MYCAARHILLGPRELVEPSPDVGGQRLVAVLACSGLGIAVTVDCFIGRRLFRRRQPSFLQSPFQAADPGPTGDRSQPHAVSRSPQNVTRRQSSP